MRLQATSRNFNAAKHQTAGQHKKCVEKSKKKRMRPQVETSRLIDSKTKHEVAGERTDKGKKKHLLFCCHGWVVGRDAAAGRRPPW